ncbi:MAG: response regulator transcription factor [Filifactoraceae bacterium]
MSNKILIIEDEEKIARVIELELVHEGYEVEKAFNGRIGLELAEKQGFDLILLDIMLPELSGIEVLRRLRKVNDVPVILLTARDSTIDKVMGLDSGADDYITKPFEIEELLARIRACLRKRILESSKEELLHNKLRINTASHEVYWDNGLIELTTREYDLLVCLLENKGRIMTRDVLLDKVWDYDFIGDTNTVDVYIRFLRSKIDEVFGVKLIHTVRGAGYIIKE